MFIRPVFATIDTVGGMEERGERGVEGTAVESEKDLRAAVVN